jgi:hypothetical protein
MQRHRLHDETVPNVTWYDPTAVKVAIVGDPKDHSTSAIIARLGGVNE